MGIRIKRTARVETAVPKAIARPTTQPKYISYIGDVDTQVIEAFSELSRHLEELAVNPYIQEACKKEYIDQYLIDLDVIPAPVTTDADLINRRSAN